MIPIFMNENYFLNNIWNIILKTEFTWLTTLRGTCLDTVLDTLLDTLLGTLLGTLWGDVGIIETAEFKLSPAGIFELCPLST